MRAATRRRSRCTPTATASSTSPARTGSSWRQGTPLLSVDTKTGEQTVVAELNDVAEKRLGLTLGGSYDVAVDPSGKRVYIGMNAGRDRDDPWGEVVLVVVELT